VHPARTLHEQLHPDCQSDACNATPVTKPARGVARGMCVCRAAPERQRNLCTTPCPSPTNQSTGPGQVAGQGLHIPPPAVPWAPAQGAALTHPQALPPRRLHTRPPTALACKRACVPTLMRQPAHQPLPRTCRSLSHPSSSALTCCCMQHTC